MTLQPFGPWPLIQFLHLYAAGRAFWTGDQPVARLLPTQRTTQRQNKCTETSMPQVEFELTIPVFEWAKTVLALDRAATVIGINFISKKNIYNSFKVKVMENISEWNEN
jgi:hypothetical protein